MRKAGGIAPLVCLLTMLGGCESPWLRPVDDPRSDTGLRVEIAAPIPIPAGSAHASLQRGRIVRGTSKLDSYCELETRTVAGSAYRVGLGSFRVARISYRLLKDPTTRIPALLTGLSCSDPLFQESVWWLAAEQPSDVMFLRCIAPYYHCHLGPPLSPDQIQQVVGRYLTVIMES
jgi:hypothetical protein